MQTRKSLAVAALALFAAAGTAQAQCPVGPPCFFGLDATGSASTRATNVNALAARNAFFANLVGVGTEDFETRSGGAPLVLTFVGAGTATLNGSGSVVIQGAGTNGAGRYPSSGTKFWETTSSANNANTFTVDFDAPVAAFGFYAADIGDFGSQLSLVFHLTDLTTTTWTLPYVAGSYLDGSLMYAGYYTTGLAFTSVDFQGTSTDDVFAFDDMTVGSIDQVVPTPEPASMVLVATGLVGVAAAARRRRRSA